MAAFATNRHVQVAVVYSVVYGGLTFFVAAFFLTELGVAGAGLAILISEAVMAAVALPKMLQLAGESFSNWIAGIAKPPWFLIRAGIDIERV